MKYAVYDSGKLAQYPNHQVHPSWNNAIFTTLTEAIAYANKWFNIYQSPNGLESVDYSGYGDIGEIRQIE